MKHAYLIIAHNEFWLLQQLIQVLDDSRNDIFIHFDKKLAAYPTLSTQHAGLSIIEQRIDVRSLFPISFSQQMTFFQRTLDEVLV